MEAENRGILRNTKQGLKRGEICPGDWAAVMAKSRKNEQALAFPMRWGFRTANSLIFNTRSETADDKPLFRDSFQFRRCLIPLTAYFEWDHHQKPYIKYRFVPSDQVSFSFLAGIYRFEGNVPVFSVLTKAPTLELSAFHDRMPVIFSQAEKATWLYGSTRDALDVIGQAASTFHYGVDC